MKTILTSLTMFCLSFNAFAVYTIQIKAPQHVQLTASADYEATQWYPHCKTVYPNEGSFHIGPKVEFHSYSAIKKKNKFKIYIPESLDGSCQFKLLRLGGLSVATPDAPTYQSISIIQDNNNTNSYQQISCEIRENYRGNKQTYCGSGQVVYIGPNKKARVQVTIKEE